MPSESERTGHEIRTKLLGEVADKEKRLKKCESDLRKAHDERKEPSTIRALRMNVQSLKDEIAVLKTKLQQNEPPTGF